MAATRKPRAPIKSARANADRGEHELVLAGVSYVLCPTFAACAAIERALDKSLMQLVREADVMSLHYDEMGVVVAELIRAGTDDDTLKLISADKCAELVFETGIGKVNAVILLALIDGVSGGRTAAGERKAQTSAIPKV